MGSALLAALTITLTSHSAGLHPNPSQGTNPDRRPRRVEVLFLGHSAGDFHNSTIAAAAVQARSAPDGIDITYTEDLKMLNADTLARYDALMFYGNYDRLSPESERALLDFVNGGKGFLAFHAASASFGNSDKYIELIGGQFESHGAEEFTAEILDPSHPIFAGVKPFKTWDETYVMKRLNPDQKMLMERVDGQGRHPWMWVRQVGKGRVFYTAYGHDQRAWKQPEFQTIIRNAILWAIDPEVKQQLEALKIQPLQYSDTGPPVANPDNRHPDPRPQLPLSLEEEQKHFQIPLGYRLELFASEPQIMNPLAMAWDERGRLWVVESYDYPNEMQPAGQGHDVIKILDDTNHDGKADKVTVFAEGLSIPTSLTLVNGGVIVAQAPDFLFLKDTNGDDRADLRKVIISGWGIFDTHAGPSNLRYGFDNWMWGSVGYSGFSGTIGGKQYQLPAGVYRFKADGQQLEWIASFSNNTWGMAFNEAGDVFGSTANNEHSTYVGIPQRLYQPNSGLEGPGRKKIEGHYNSHPNSMVIRQTDVYGGFTAATGHNFYTARDFPRDFWNQVAFVNEPTAKLVHRANIRRDGSGYAESDGWNLVANDDEWFSPIQSEVGPDGAIWILDWHKFVILHNAAPPSFKVGKGGAHETPLRTLTRRGRVYRLVWNGAKQRPPMSLDINRPNQLLAALRNDNMFWRMTAQRLLVERGNTDVVDSLYAIASDESVDPVGLNGPVIHALWTLRGLGAFDGKSERAMSLIHKALQHRSAAVRINAIRAMPRTDRTLDEILNGDLLRDADLSVRLNAVIALGEYPASAKIGKVLYGLSKDSVTAADEWLSEAVAAAGIRHSGGFFSAYADDIGITEFLKLAAQAARGELENFPNLAGYQVNDSLWQTVQIPHAPEQSLLGNNAGDFWIRKTFKIEIRGADFSEGATLRLPPINGSDITYLNGTRIGTQPGGGPREYYIPRDMIRWGDNTIAIRISNTWWHPGIIKDSVGIMLTGKNFSVPLSGDWKFKVEVSAPPGDRQRAITTSAPIAQQLVGLINPLADLRKPTVPFERPVFTQTAPTGAPKPKVDTLRVSLGVAAPMKFDKPLIRAKAGRPIVITFTNTASDVPHNFVLFDLIAKATLDKLMTQEAKNAKAAAERGYIPQSKAVLQSTKLLDPKQSAVLRFTVPSKPGDYLFVCTFPGHYKTMRGILRVTR